LKPNFPRLLKYIHATVYATVLIAKVYAEKRNNTDTVRQKKTIFNRVNRRDYYF